MKKLFPLLLTLLLLGCSAKEYVECKNPVEIKGKIYCEK